MELTFRPITTQDLPDAYELIRLAYQRPPGYQSDVARYLLLQPDGWLLAEEGERFAALGGIMCYRTFGYIGLISVHPELQRQGLGLAIMNRLLEVAESQSCPTLLLDASPGGASLYRKMGFSTEGESAEYKLRSPQLVDPLSRSGPAPTRLQAEELAEVAAFDAPGFGADRTSVLASYLQSDPERCFVSRDKSGSVTGYLIAQAATLGPWNAANPQIAEQLLRHALTLPYKQPPNVLVDADHRAARELLTAYGFERARSLMHMRSGPPLARGRQTVLYGQASFALG